MSASRGRKVRAQLYQELGLSEGASEEDVKTAYRKLALQWCATRRLRAAAAAVAGCAVSSGRSRRARRRAAASAADVTAATVWHGACRHPDKNPAPEARERFQASAPPPFSRPLPCAHATFAGAQEISYAYRVLTKQEAMEPNPSVRAEAWPLFAWA
jgi:hypothetical protein